MSIEFKETTSAQLPTRKRIIIGGAEVGDATPSISGDRLTWHASFKIGEPLEVHTFLIQGHGPTPAAAVAIGIAKARQQRDVFAKLLESLEKELGTTGKSAEELKAVGA